MALVVLASSSGVLIMVANAFQSKKIGFRSMEGPQRRTKNRNTDLVSASWAYNLLNKQMFTQYIKASKELSKDNIIE